ncbi:MAG: S9 family peptidase [Chloroflexota bacterium]
MIDLESLLRVPHVDPEIGFDISPDGAKVAFAWNLSGQWEVYEVNLDGSESPTRVSRGPGNKFGPRYTPDGRHLAYTLDFDGSENFHILVCDLVTGKNTDLTPDVKYAQHPYLAWSPDGQQIAFVSNETGSFCAQVMNADGSDRHLVLDTGMPVWSVHWSPDSQRLAVLGETQGQDFGVFIVPVQGSEAYQITHRGVPLNAHNPAWSPDGRRLAFNSDIYGYHQVGFYEIGSGQVSWVTSGEGEKTQPVWSPDGRRLAYVHNQGVDSWLSVCEIDGTPRTYQVEPGVHYLPKFTPDGQYLVFLFDNPRHPTDLWSLSLENGSFQPLTDSLPAELTSSPFVMPEEIRYPSMDGVPVPAMLFHPTGADASSPAVVIVHGGPSWLFSMLWYPIMAHMASRGWVVLAPNYRGSTGYGREWQLANRFDMGGVDTRDVAAGALYLAQKGLADPNRIAVTGRSHGGYLTMTCMTQYPELWAGGSAVVPFLNWFTSHANSRQDLQHWDRENMGDPHENYDLWYERSPFFFLDRIQAPVQLICGANDPRCPVSESIQARDKLRELGKQVDFVLYPDEGHAFLKVENVVASEVRRVEFLAQILER